MVVCDLEKNWQLRYEELFAGRDDYAKVAGKQNGWMEVASLPCDVHVPLIENSVISDPVVADNCFACEWIEDKSWWFRKIFDAGNEPLISQSSELVVEGLDAEADLFLNGRHLGRHKSQTYPFREEIRDLLRKTGNELVIRLTSGLEYVNELELSQIHWKGTDYASNRFIRKCGDRRDDRRVFVRKPQYVYGWDWNPRIATCGIMGGARIQCYNSLAIRNVKFTTESIGEQSAQICVDVEIENLYPITTIDADVAVDILYNGVSVRAMEKDVFLTSGLNYIRFNCVIDSPRLWWPNGTGPQNLYTVRVRAAASGGMDDCEFETGIRTVRLDTGRTGEVGRMFAFELNGVKVFCKGGNWETPDSIYGRITDEKYDTLVKEAKEANFNMFRLNGVGAYERDYFYECCDRCGILIWQDFTFSCAAYPDHLDWFAHEAEREVDYQIKRLRNHPCIALWCGNNECQISLENYGKYSYLDEKKPAFPRGIVLYNQIIPRLVRENCGEIPYWNSSPFGGSPLNCEEYGDRHPWGESFMSNNIIKRATPEEYDSVKGRFISEFGCIGPTRKSSLVKYYGGDKVIIGSDIWKLHTNEFEVNTIKAAIAKHYKDPDDLSLEEYLLYAGLFQGLTLGYAFESLRYAQYNYGALVWSYNDCWGEVGWSIIDYYTRRKIAYYFVKRALAHKKLIMREGGGTINIVCMNDTPETLKFKLTYGYVTFDGCEKDAEAKTVIANPFTKAIIVAKMEKAAHDTSRGVYFANTDKDCDIAPAILRTSDFRNLRIPRPEIKITVLRIDEKEIAFTVSSDKYAHGVHFGLNDDLLLSDEYFDLLPGEIKEITIKGHNLPADIGDVIPKYVGL